MARQFSFDPCDPLPDHLFKKARWSAEERAWRQGMTSIAAGGPNNVVQFTRRLNVVDQELASYLKELNVAMQEKAGVSYIAIRSSLHGSDLDAIRSFLDNAVEAPDAALQIMRDHGLRGVNAKVTPEVAGAYNKTAAAISEFVAESPNWHRSDDGRIFAVFGETIALLHPVRYRKESPNEPEAFGFGIELREGAEVDYFDGSITHEGTLGERFAGWDLAKPLEQMHTHIASRDKAREFSF